nr:acyl carrier protein [Paenibacillus forsythiae]
MEALESLLAGPLNQLALIKTDFSWPWMESSERIQVLAGNSASFADRLRRRIVIPAFEKPENGGSRQLAEQVRDTVIRLAAELCGVTVTDIDLDSEIEEYKFDTVQLNAWIANCNEAFGLELDSSALLERQTWKDFADYLVHQFGNSISLKEEVS